MGFAPFTPFLVVTRITPFAPLDPYIAEEAASLRTSIDSMSDELR